MTSFRTNSAVRSVIIAMTLLGWLVLSNHCALGGMAQTVQVQKEHACCHNGGSTPAKQSDNGKACMQCCKSIRALVAEGVKVAALTPPTVVVAILPALFRVEAEAIESRVLASDTGPPPRAVSFSELVLHRSLRSHAPPFLT